MQARRLQVVQFWRDKRAAKIHVHSRDALSSRRVFPECRASGRMYFARCLIPCRNFVSYTTCRLPSSLQGQLHWFLRKPIKRVRKTAHLCSTVVPPVSDQPKCQDKMFTYGRWSLARIHTILGQNFASSAFRTAETYPFR